MNVDFGIQVLNYYKKEPVSYGSVSFLMLDSVQNYWESFEIDKFSRLELSTKEKFFYRQVSTVRQSIFASHNANEYGLETQVICSPN